MSTGCLKKPSRPPPPPPIEYPSSQQFQNFHRLSQSGSSNNNGYSSHFLHHSQYQHQQQPHRKLNSRSDYIKISECHTGIPGRPPPKPAGFKSRASTSFSSTLKPSTSNFVHSSHQKSRSLTDNHLGSSYLYLDLPSSLNSKNNAPSPPSSTVYKTVDFLKTDALNKCKVERTSGRSASKGQSFIH